MHNLLLSLIIFAVIFSLLWISISLGQRFGVRSRNLSKGEDAIAQVAEGTIFALFGLLMAFTVTGAYDRFQERKLRIIDEVNAIETAYKRIGLLPSDSQEELRSSMRQYLDTRIALYQRLTELSSNLNNSHQLYDLQQKIWGQTLYAATKADAATNILFVPAVNNMFEIVNLRAGIRNIHTPFAILILLIAMGMSCSFIVGYVFISKYFDEKSYNNYLFVLAYTFITAFSVYIVFELEFPRSGLIRLDKFDHMLIELRSHLN